MVSIRNIEKTVTEGITSKAAQQAATTEAVKKRAVARFGPELSPEDESRLKAVREEESKNRSRQLEMEDRLGIGKREKEELAEGTEDALDKANLGEDIAEKGKIGILPRWMSRAGYKTKKEEGAVVEAMRMNTVQATKDLEDLYKITKGASKEDYKQFNTLYKAGQDRQVWHEDVMLDMLDINPKAKEMYKAFKTASDKNWVSANEIAYKIKKARGMVTNEYGEIVKPVRNQDIHKIYDRISVLDEEGNLINSKNMSYDDFKKKYIDQGKTLVAMDGDAIISKDLRYSHYLADAPEFKPLQWNVLPYVPGGSRYYTPNTHFVKIGRAFYSDSGTLFHGFAKTLVAGENVKQLNKYAEDVNNLIDIWKRTGGDLTRVQEELDRLNPQAFPVNSAEDLKALMRTETNPNGIIDPHYKAVVLRGDEKYVNPETPEIRNLETLDNYDEGLSDLMYIRGTYFKSKGDEILHNINGGYTHMVSPLGVWQRNIEQAARNNTLGQMMVDYAEWFKRNFRAVIDDQRGTYNIDNMSGAQVIATAKIVAKNSQYERLARAAKTAQIQYRNLLGMPTQFDVAVSNYLRNFLRTALPKRWWDSAAMDWLMRTKPIDAVNAIIFRNYLGCFNVKQFFLQGPLTMANMAWMHPQTFVTAQGAAPALLIAHFTKDKRFLNQIHKMLPHIGISKEDFNGILKFMEDYGTFKQFSQRPEMSEQVANWLRGPNGWKNLDLVFTQTGNNMSQFTADVMGYLLSKTKDSRDICRISDNLMLNMNRANTSALQRSFLGKVIAQFTSYPLAAFEALTGNHFTMREKGMFLLGSLYMWGFGGTFAKDKATNLYRFAEEYFPDVDKETMGKFIDGHITYALAQMGIYVNEGTDFWGMFNQLSATIPAIQSVLGSVPDLPIASGVSIFADNIKAAKNLIRPDTGVLDYLHWAKTVNESRGVNSGLKNFTRWYFAWDANQFLNRHGDVLKEDPTTFQLFATIAGFRPIESELDQRDYLDAKYEREAIQDYFNKEIKEKISPFITYKNTSSRHELAQNRDNTFIQIQSDAETAVRDFLSWVRTNHKDYVEEAEKYIDEIYNVKYRDIELRTGNIRMGNIDRNNKQRLGIQE